VEARPGHALLRKETASLRRRARQVTQVACARRRDYKRTLRPRCNSTR
jgi:hypothetical protein